jgi:hypothetical protein
MPPTQRTVWDRYVEKAFFALLSACAIFLSDKISGMSKSVEELNVKIAILVSQVGLQDGINKDFEIRLRTMEKKWGRK